MSGATAAPSTTARKSPVDRDQLLAQFMPLKVASPLDELEQEDPYLQLGEAIHVHISRAEYLAMPDSLKARLIQDETEPDF